MDKHIPPETIEWIVEQARNGHPPETLLKPLIDNGWTEDDAIDAVEQAMRGYLDAHARDSGLPPSVPVPSPIELNGASVLDAGDRQVHVLASLMLPRVVVFGGLLDDAECDELIALSRVSLKPSSVVDPATGGDQLHKDRTSAGTHFARGANALVSRIEARIAKLLDWPVVNGEAIQILRYGAGAQYRPHYDYFDPEVAGSAAPLRRGGQRVASVVMYLNNPERGGATTFPDVNFEVAAVKGNAVFFSYDRPHPMTRTLHGGAPVQAGEKWIATKWLREGRHD